MMIVWGGQMSRTSRHTLPLQIKGQSNGTKTVFWHFNLPIWAHFHLEATGHPRWGAVLGYILRETIPQMFQKVGLFKSPKTSKASCTNKDGPLSSIGTPGWCFWYERALLRQRSRCCQFDVTIVVRLMEKKMMRTICNCSSLRSKCDSDK